MSKNIFKPQYRVHRNVFGFDWAVVINDNIVPVFVSEQGSRKLYFHQATGRQSALYPTLRDCVVNIVYGV